MTLNGRLSVEFDIKSPVLKFFRHYLQMSGLSIDNVVKKELELEPPEKSKVQYRIDGFQLSWWYKEITSTDDSDVAKRQDPDWYSKLEGIMTVIETEYNNGSRASHALWTVEFEKIRDDIPDPRFITDNIATYFQEVDESMANL